MEFLIESRPNCPVEPVQTIESQCPKTRENAFYNKRYDRWFNFNLAWSAIRLGDEDLNEVSLDEIEPEFDVSLDHISFDSSLSTSIPLSISTNCCQDAKLKPDIVTAPIPFLNIFNEAERFREFVRSLVVVM